MKFRDTRSDSAGGNDSDGASLPFLSTASSALVLAGIMQVAVGADAADLANDVSWI